MNGLLRPVADFADGGPSEEEGRRAMEALVVPPIALAFSLAGALVHIFKAANYLTLWLSRFLMYRLRGVTRTVRTTAFLIRFRREALVLSALTLAVAPCFVSNRISTSQGFGWLLEHTAENLPWAGRPIAGGMRWAVQAQPYFYPVNEAVRTRLPLIGTFGVRDPPN